jgi:hypothetical protein
MNMLLKLLITLAVLLGSRAVPAGERPPLAVALKLDAFKDGLRLCSRPVPKEITSYWEVKQIEVGRIDAALKKFAKQGGLKPRVGMPLDLSFYGRQYLGLTRGGRRIVYINAFPAAPDVRGSKARTQLVDECEGGLFWGVEYDIESRSFLNFSMNRTECKVPLLLNP